MAWTPDRPLDELKARWAQAPSQFMDVNGLQVHLRDEGQRDDPSPIVLLHGTSASLHTWQGWVEALGTNRRVIRIDLPGFGLTGPSAANDYSAEAYVVFVRAAMDKLAVNRFVIGGNSLGGQVAWSVALAMPGRVDGLILVDASGFAPESFKAVQTTPLGFRLAATPVLRFVSQYTLPRAVVERSLKDVYGDPSRVTPALVDLYEAMALRAGNRQALVRRIEQGYTGDVARLKDIHVPTLILWGGKDRVVPPECAQRFARAIAGSQLVMFEELGHLPQEEDPVGTVGAVRRFLMPQPAQLAALRAQ
ncbi:alpha/beta fold hydrolase [Caenimonas koreensis]|nr:alpha/beta hydrolase [Caenimonas koreensis]